MWGLSFLTNNKVIKDKDYPNLCLYPFFNVMVTAHGMYKPCCKWTDHLKSDGKYLQAPHDSLSDAFHSDEMISLRKDMLKGKRHAACEVCWNEEAQGIPSMRKDSFAYQLEKDVLNIQDFPKRMDLYMSNICNLKCRICSPTYSTKWIQEAKDTLGLEETVHQNFTDTNIDYVKICLPHIVELGLFGGEPLYNKETEELLEYCIEHGWSKNIQLLINTNGTIYSEKWVSIFKSFKKVLLNFSLDDIGERFEYQRKGAHWNDVKSNVLSYLKNGGVKSKDKIECKICCTVSTLNVYYLPAILREFDTLFPNMNVFLNFLHGPYCLSIRNMPSELKGKVKKYLIENSHSNIDKGFSRGVSEVIDFISLSPNCDFQKFFEEIQRGDKYRKESFKDVFPEFWQMIQEYELIKKL